VHLPAQVRHVLFPVPFVITVYSHLTPLIFATDTSLAAGSGTPRPSGSSGLSASTGSQFGNGL
ncbi:hypothetical protein ACQP3J_27600, partial [Escherichia coli]